MNLRQLEYFIAISETMNFTKAANNLFISQTALTKQIKSLEKELDTLLFNRDSKQISLTDSGKYFLIEAKKIINQVNLSKNNFISYQQGITGNLKIGFLKNLDPNLLVKIISKLNKKYPLLTIELNSYSNHELYQQLESATIDLALTMSNHDPRYQQILINKYPLVVLVNKKSELAKKNKLHQSELNNILFDVRKIDNQNKFSEFEGNLLKIACNQGCAILHAFVKDNCYNQYIKAIPLEPVIEEGIYLVYDKNNHNPAINNFVSLIKNKSLNV